MRFKFNADEIFEMAEQIERNGAKFYRRAAELFKGPQTGQIFLGLASMEDEHEKIFAAMRASLTEQERKETVYDPDGQAVLYLRAMANGFVFDIKAEPAKRLTGKEKMEDILKMAIGFEKDSIVFYLGIKDVVPERLGKERIDAIIKEEMSHIASLSKNLKTFAA